MIQRYILSLFCILLLSLLAYIPINSTAQVYEDLTGIWKGQDGSTYYVTHLPAAANIMWVGLSADDGKTWANVFVGIYNGDKITGTWADVPRGKAGGSGTLTLEVWKSGQYVMMGKIGSTGSGFGTSNWQKPSCARFMGFEAYICGWNRDIPDPKRGPPPGGPPLQPPPGFGK
jgi:hypothetical protein